jgi:hypothetical protein
LEGKVVMANDPGTKCKHPACDCPAAQDSKYCGEYCEDAEKAGVLEIGCGCEHAACKA